METSRLSAKRNPTAPDRKWAPPLSGRMTELQAAEMASLGAEALMLILLATHARVAELAASVTSVASSDSLSSPSAATPVYLKPKTPGRKKKPGAKEGHTGSRRKAPVEIDATAEHRLEVCPCCSGPLQRCRRTRTRVIEDIPREITPVVTEHILHRDYCPVCRKHVEPTVPDAMPNATLGHHIVALGSWFHYGLGVTISQVREILGSHLHTAIRGGLRRFGENHGSMWFMPSNTKFS